MTFTINPTVAALIPEAILDRVQNGVDTEFTEASDRGELETAAKWKGKVRVGNKDGTKPTRLKIGKRTTEEWLLRQNGPGQLILLSIYMDNLEADLGQLGVASLPDFAVTWFASLERAAKRDAEVKAAATKP